jgi:hypothetical protein
MGFASDRDLKKRGSRSIARLVPIGFAWLLVALFQIWAVAALNFDVKQGGLRLLAVSGFILSTLAAFISIRRCSARLLACATCCFVVLFWWLSLRPSNEGNWQTDVSRLANAEVNGDTVVIHNVRNCRYRSEFDYTCQWETRTYDLARLRGMDAYFVNWGSPWIAHTMISFDFGNDQYVTFSIETRKKVGQSYSAVRGFFRQYEIIYIVADERDVVRLRTNYRTGEEVYLYRLKTSPDRARARFLEYIGRVNDLHQHPEWYNALTKNCTTSIFAQRDFSHPDDRKIGWLDWQILLNGKLDEKAYREGAFAGDLPFEELKSRAHINATARALGDDPEFSRRIREGRPGFEPRN